MQRYHSPMINLYCRESKKDKTGKSPIEMGINVNGVRKFINTPMKAVPSEFNRKRRPKELQEYVDAIRMRFDTVICEMLKAGEPITVAALKEYMRSGGYKAYTIKNMFDDYLSILSKRVDVDLTIGVYRKYELVRNLFFEYVNPEAECTSITNATVKRFQVDVYAKYNTSTAAGYLTKLKTFIKFGMDNDKIKVNPLQGIKVKKAAPKIEFLTESEINRIYNMKIDNQSLANVRDAFILQASTGLAYCDICSLRKDDIIITDDGTHYISKCRNKTGTQYTSVVLPMGIEVLKRHNYELHIISNQKYNTMLKAIQTLTGITTTMTTHLARKTYATYLLNKGVRIESVSRALGHKNVKITQSAYAQFLNKTIIEEIKGKI